MILSLGVVGLSFCVLIAILGVSDIGEHIIGIEGSATYAMNTTMWTAASWTGGYSWAYIACAAVVGLISLSVVVYLWHRN